MVRREANFRLNGKAPLGPSIPVQTDEDDKQLNRIGIAVAPQTAPRKKKKEVWARRRRTGGRRRGCARETAVRGAPGPASAPSG